MPRRKTNPNGAAGEPAPSVPLAAGGGEDPGRPVPISKARGKALDDESARINDSAESEVGRRLSGEKEVRLNADYPTRFRQAKQLYPSSRVRFTQILPVEDENIPARLLQSFRDYDEIIAYVRDVHWRGEDATYKWEIYEESRRWTTGQIKFRADPRWAERKNGSALADEERPMQPPSGGYGPGYQQQPQPPGYRPGDVVNGYQFDGRQWNWLGAQQPQPPAAPPQVQPQPQYQQPQPPPPQVIVQPTAPAPYQPPPPPQAPPPDNDLTMRLVNELSAANARAARAEEVNRSLDQRMADLERRATGVAAQPAPAAPAPAPVQQPVQPQPQPIYRPGDIVNGHQFDGRQWNWLAAPPPAQAQQPAAPPVAPVNPVVQARESFGVVREMMRMGKEVASEFSPPEKDDPPPAPEPPKEKDDFPVQVREAGPLTLVAVDGKWQRDPYTVAAFNAGKAADFVSNMFEKVTKALDKRGEDQQKMADHQAQARQQKIVDTERAARALTEAAVATERLKVAQSPAQPPPVQQFVAQQPQQPQQQYVAPPPVAPAPAPPLQVATNIVFESVQVEPEPEPAPPVEVVQ